MPHKRAKKSIRDATTASIGFNNAPTASDNDLKEKEEYGGMSKNLYRILNAEKIRKERKEKDTLKRKREEEGDKEGRSKPNPAAPGAGQSSSKEATKKLQIKPGESLKSYNSRVEIALRPSISSAIKSSKTSRKKAKLSRSEAAKQGKDDEEASLHKPPPRRGEKERASEFAGKEKVALNDVAMEPPNLVKMQNRRAEQALLNNAKSKERSGKKELPVSMKQQQEMEVEREKAIAMYRDLKARQAASKET